jgi:hypothetical protein
MLKTKRLTNFQEAQHFKTVKREEGKSGEFDDCFKERSDGMNFTK